MKTKQYQGRTREAAIEEARRELGDDFVVMHTEKKLLGPFVVTIGVEDDVPLPNYKEAFEMAQRSQTAPVSRPSFPRFDMVADEEVRIPAVPEQPQREQLVFSGGIQESSNQEVQVSAEDIRQTFRAVEEVIAQSNAQPAQSVVPGTYDKRATLVHYNDPARSVEYTRDGGTKRPRRRQYSPPAEAQDEFTVEGEVEDERRDDGEARTGETGSKIIRAIYNVLLRNEVDERYINQVMAELDIHVLNEVSIETALGLVYQKLVLKFGRPKLIELGEKKPKVVFFIGPTGVGKTTTIAKLASDFRLNQKKKVALFTADTYRIAAEKQLSVYGELMNIDVVVLYVDDQDDINEKIAGKYARYDLILVDTTGFSHRDEEQRRSISELLDSLSDRYDKQVYLVLSATTKYRDLKEIVDVYRGFTDFDLLFTKLDETEVYGNLLNIKLYAKVPLSYVTTGQIVPDDLEVIDPQKMVHSLLGGGM